MVGHSLCSPALSLRSNTVVVVIVVIASSSAPYVLMRIHLRTTFYV
jgi:hypothetical protein